VPQPGVRCRAAVRRRPLTCAAQLRATRPATGRTLSARARVPHAGRRRAVCRCDLYAVAEDGTETLVAAAQGTVLAVEPRSS
jgi:acyl-coenzyme A thioesterase PaaI-like protein